jgi:hypothetical protein
MAFWPKRGKRCRWSSWRLLGSDRARTVTARGEVVRSSVRPLETAVIVSDLCSSLMFVLAVETADLAPKVVIS